MTTYDSSRQEPSKTTPNTHFLYLALAPWCRTVYTSTALHEWYYVRRQPGANVLNVGQKKNYFPRLSWCWLSGVASGRRQKLYSKFQMSTESFIQISSKNVLNCGLQRGTWTNAGRVTLLASSFGNNVLFEPKQKPHRTQRGKEKHFRIHKISIVFLFEWMVNYFKLLVSGPTS